MLELITTNDGSKTIFNSEVGENYHSKHGALQESRHVFLHSGLIHFLQNNQLQEVRVLEVGFGTGLNFLLSAEYSLETHIRLYYTGIEAFPLPESIIRETGYEEYVSEETWRNFLRVYNLSINTPVEFNSYCSLKIAHSMLLDYKDSQQYDVIYFDAFAAIHQPDMWTFEALEHATKFLKSGGVFVTYAITGNLKRTMKSLGFTIEKAPGAPGKREMLRATKK